MQPDFSPWGEIDWCETLIPGMEMVATPSHDGIMVSREASILLSPAARKCGGGSGCFCRSTAERPIMYGAEADRKWLSAGALLPF